MKEAEDFIAGLSRLAAELTDRRTHGRRPRGALLRLLREHRGALAGHERARAAGEVDERHTIALLLRMISDLSTEDSEQ